jgi:type II secretory pathway pseudopilin PulG
MKTPFHKVEILMRNKRIRQAQGFTLVEVLLATTILSFGVIAIVGLLPASFQIIQNTSNSTAIAITAQTIMDEVFKNNTYAPASAMKVETNPLEHPSLYKLDYDKLASLTGTARDAYLESLEPLATFFVWGGGVQVHPSYQVVYVQAVWKKGKQENPGIVPEYPEDITLFNTYTLVGSVSP